MQIIAQRRKFHLPRAAFLGLVDSLVLRSEFVSEDVEIVHQLLAGEAIYDMRTQGEMVPNGTVSAENVNEEQLEGAAAAMSYFCDKYGIVKGFILGELYFRGDLSRGALRSYAVVLRRMGDRLARVRSDFLFWLTDVHYKDMS
jgi:hypothetical protein